jgi:hypothetical protein
MKTKIYTLVDPITNQVRYVGITEGTLHNRLLGHLKEARARKEFNPNRKHKWINSLLSTGIPPVILLIDEVDSDPEWWEVWWMEYLTSLGVDLLNIITTVEQYITIERRTIFQFSLDGNFMRYFDSVVNAASAVDGNDAIIHRAARQKCGYKAYGYQWRYAYETNIGPAKSKKQPNVNTQVIQYSMDGTYIKSWVSGQEAANVLGLLKSKISNCCNGKRKSHGGFTWSFN